LMVQVPDGAKVGTELMVMAPDQHPRFVRVPSGLCPGHYFPILIAALGREILLAETAEPQELRFIAPNNAQPGQHLCVQGPHGPVMVPLPEDVQPGLECSYRLGPQDDYPAYQLTVPENARPGMPMQFPGTDGEELTVIVPAGKLPGDSFQVMQPLVMVRVPPAAREGQELMFQTPCDQQVRFATVPVGASPGHYFPVLLSRQRSPSYQSS
jgi:hypothetical protein